MVESREPQLGALAPHFVEGGEQARGGAVVRDSLRTARGFVKSDDRSVDCSRTWSGFALRGGGFVAVESLVVGVAGLVGHLEHLVDVALLVRLVELA